MAQLLKKVGPLKKIVLGQCHPSKVDLASRIIVQKLEFDNFLNAYFNKYDAYFAFDPKRMCKSGDIVLIEELPEKMTRDITHSVLKVIYPLGDISDPVTGKKCIGVEYREDLARKIELWGKNPDNTFNYDRAPQRGWQEGRKDFSHKQAYVKWHEFPDNDQPEAELLHDINYKEPWYYYYRSKK